MHLRLKFLSFASVTLVFSLSSTQPLLCTPVNSVPSDLEAKGAKNLDAKVDYLSQQDRERLIVDQSLAETHSVENPLKLNQGVESSPLQNTAFNVKEVERLNEFVEVDTSLNDTSQAIEFLKKDLAIAQKSGNREMELKLLIALGEVYTSSGKYDKAAESASASLAIAQDLQNFKAKAISFITLANAYQSSASSPREYQKSVRTAMSGLTTAWKIKDSNVEAKALSILGSGYSFLDEHGKALLFAKQAVKVAEANQMATVAASSLLTLADIQLREGEYQHVIESTTQAIDYLQDLQNHEAEAAALLMQSLAHFGRGNSQKSLDVAEQSLVIAREVNNSSIEALAFIVLSLNYSDSENVSKAIELLNQSRKISKEQKNIELEAIALEVLGEIYNKLGQNEKAIATYQEAISMSDSFSAKAALARVYENSNLVGTAITYYKQAINKNEEEVTRRIHQLPFWLQASFPKAIQELSGVPTTQAYRSLANLLLSQRRTVEAQQVLELLKGQELREYTGDSLTQSQPASLTITPIEEQILEEYGSLITFGQHIDECQRTNCPQLEQLLEQRDSLTKYYYQVLEQLESLIRNIRNSDEVFLDPQEFALKARSIVESRPDTVLIYPLVLEDRIWLLWASKGGIFKSVEVTGVTQAQLGVWVMRFRQLLQNPLSNTQEVKAVGKQLYSWLIEPLEGELKANNIRHLVFSLDRSTRYIPMSTLFDGETYLVENYTVSTVLSANLTDTSSTVNTAKAPTFRRGTRSSLSSEVANAVVASLSEIAPFSEISQEPLILGLGVSDAIAGFPPLPHVPAELDAIVRQDLMEEAGGIYPGQKFLDDGFDFFALRDNLSGHQLLHIATHSEFIPGRANKSFLLLGTGERLAIPDIVHWLDLQNIDLVVLSSCETALGGPGQHGKEIAGIGYYFLKGGADSVMASLWRVDDESTRLLMEQFYRNLAKGTPDSLVTKAEALRQAQLTLLRGEETDSTQAQGNSTLPAAQKSPFQHPYYWSGFILMGSGQ